MEEMGQKKDCDSVLCSISWDTTNYNFLGTDGSVENYILSYHNIFSDKAITLTEREVDKILL